MYQIRPDRPWESTTSSSIFARNSSIGRARCRRAVGLALSARIRTYRATV
ncbi:hypothetical protein J7E98_07205 [Streptomyces sp. ISL-86]|nr:hypothetical protein [Streptomyces sp. ISL-86]